MAPAVYFQPHILSHLSLVYFIHWCYRKILYFWMTPSHSGFAHSKRAWSAPLSTLNLFVKKPGSIREGWMVPSSIKSPLTSTPSRTCSLLYHDHRALHTEVRPHVSWLLLYLFASLNGITILWSSLYSSSDNFFSTSVGPSWVVLNTYFIILQVPYLLIISCYKGTMKTETYMPRQVWIYF